MNDFVKKVRAAAVATWWTVLVGYALLTITWLVYLALVIARPEWLLTLWGGKSIYFRDPAGNSVELVTPGIWGLPSGW